MLASVRSSDQTVVPLICGLGVQYGLTGELYLLKSTSKIDGQEKNCMSCHPVLFFFVLEDLEYLVVFWESAAEGEGQHSTPPTTMKSQETLRESEAGTPAQSGMN